MNDATKILIKNFIEGQAKLAGAAVSSWLVTRHLMDPSMSGTLTDILIATAVGAATSGYAWWTSVGRSRVETKLQKLTGTTTTADAVVVAAAAPAAPPVSPAQVAQAAAKVASILILGVFLLSSTGAFAQGNVLQGLAQRNDVNKLGGVTNVSPLVAGAIKTPDDLIQRLVAMNLSDFQYAKARAAAASNTITLPCWTAWVSLLEKAQATLKDDKGNDLVKPDPHIFSDLEAASELIQSLQPGGPIQVGCAPFADATKKSVAQLISSILGGGALGGLLPISPLLPIP